MSEMTEQELRIAIARLLPDEWREASDGSGQWFRTVGKYTVRTIPDEMSLLLDGSIVFRLLDRYQMELMTYPIADYGYTASASIELSDSFIASSPRRDIACLMAIVDCVKACQESGYLKHLDHEP